MVCSLSLLASSTSQAEIERVIVTGKKCKTGTCRERPVSDQVLNDYDPYAAPIGAGNPALTTIRTALKDAAQRFEPTCVPPGSSEQEHRSAQALLCAAKAIAEVSTTSGIVASVISADSARITCMAEIGQKLAMGDCKAE